MKYLCRKPGRKSVRVLKRDRKVITKCLTREYSFVFDRAKGSHIWDLDGRKYLDFCASIAVSNIGHSNPDVVNAVRKQAGKGMHCGFSDFNAEVPVAFAEYLLTFFPKKFNNTFLSNSGTESVECAYKIARWHTNRKYVIAFEGAFHGRTMGSLSLTKSKPVHRQRYAPFLPVKHTPYAYCYRCKFGKEEGDCHFECLNALEKTMRSVKGGLAAVFIEPIQGEGGYIVPPRKFIKGVRQLCNEYGALLCDDEVQAGCFRTGKFLGIENFKVTPDIVSMSKALGGGVPLGVTVSSKKIMDWPKGAHANTFGGNLLACAGGLASLKFMRKHKLGEKSKKIGKIMIKKLNDMKHEYELIGDVRGKGLMIGVEFVTSKKTKRHAVHERNAILCSAAEKGLLLLPTGESAIRICPPLTITREQAEKGLDILEDAVSHHKKYR